MHPTAHRRTSRWLLLCAALALSLPAWLPAQSFAGGWRAARLGLGLAARPA